MYDKTKQDSEFVISYFSQGYFSEKKWIVAIKWDEGPAEFHVTKSTVVCSDHFITSHYANGKRQGITSGPSRSGKTLRRLRKDAVLFLSIIRKCRRKPTLCDNEVATNLPVYGPPNLARGPSIHFPVFIR